MPVAEIIAIGTELLLGEIQDTNTRYLARRLRDEGIDIYRTMIVGDNPGRIASAIREAMQRCQIVITTGGLGPTVDDPTRQAVAQAMGVETDFHPELWEQIQNRFRKRGIAIPENNRRQAYIPRHAIPVPNPVGTAPAFIVETPEHAIISLPGVPREMEYLVENQVFPYLKKRFNLQGIIMARVLHTSGMGESAVDELVCEMETETNPTLGLLAHPGQVDLRITAKAPDEKEALRLIEGMQKRIYKILGDHIYGVDGETLESVILKRVSGMKKSIFLVECGLEGEIKRRFSTAGLPLDHILSQPRCLPGDAFSGWMKSLEKEHPADLLAGFNLDISQERPLLNLVVFLNSRWTNAEFTFGGQNPYAHSWAATTGLDFLLRNVINTFQEA